MDKTREIQFFDKFHNKDYDVLDKRGYQRILAEFNRLVRPKKGEQCIDFGCGSGAFTKYLCNYGLKITGIDISPGIIAYAKKHIPGISFIVGDIEKTGLPDNSVDIVVFSGVLHHFDNYSKTLQEAYRILRTGGRIFSYDPNKYNPVMWLYRDEKSPISSKKGRTDNERLLSIDELRFTIKNAGFDNSNVYAISGVTFKYVESNTVKKLLFFYNLFERTLDKLPFADKFGSFLIACARKHTTTL